MLPSIFLMTFALAATPDDKSAKIEPVKLPDYPEAVSSFGGAVCDGWLYVYSGHIGTAHAHSKDNLTESFRRLNLADPKAWEDLPAGERLQGMPLVAHKGLLYRIGGLSARNAKGEEADLHSVASVQQFDTKAQTWSECPPLPRGRSSHDAVIAGDKIYVIGGWSLAGSDQEWLESGLVLDLNDPSKGWTEFQVPFKRRALALAESRGKLYAIGGMNDDDKPSNQVDVLDIANGVWTSGPAVPGKPMNSFGVSAWGTEECIFVLNLDGNLYRLSESNGDWEVLASTGMSRFFHRLLPVSSDELVVVAGANMIQGHLATVGKLRVK